MNLFRLWLVGLGLFVATLVGRADGPQTVVAPGLFSYQAPPGWTAQDSPISKYKVSFAPPVNGFAANINVVIDKAAMSLNDYVTASLSQLKATPMLVNVKVVSQQPFQTAGGLDGQRVVVTDAMGKMDLQQTFYFFDGGSNAKLVVTASCLSSDGAADAPLFDAALKTFTLE